MTCTVTVAHPGLFIIIYATLRYVVCLLSSSSIMSYDGDDSDTNLRQAALSLASSTACCMLLSCSDF